MKTETANDTDDSREDSFFKRKFDWDPPKQSFFCCAFYSLLCILVGIIFVFTNNPTYDQDYNTPALLHILQTIIISIKEWQFLAPFVASKDRVFSDPVSWTIVIGVPFLGMIIYRSILLATNLKSLKPKSWILDDDISFIKSYCILFFLCFGTTSFLSARISLPKRAYYDICNYNLQTEECEKDSPKTLEKALSSFPNPQMAFIIASLFHFSLYQTTKMLMFLNVYFKTIYNDKPNNENEENEIMLQKSNENHMNNNNNNNNNNNDDKLEESQSNGNDIPDMKHILPSTTIGMSEHTSSGTIIGGKSTTSSLRSPTVANINASILGEESNNNTNTNTNPSTYSATNPSQTNTDNTFGNDASSNLNDPANQSLSDIQKGSIDTSNNDSNHQNKNTKSKRIETISTVSEINEINDNNSNNDINNNDNDNNNDNSKKDGDFCKHRLLSVYVLILLLFGFLPLYLGIFMCITFIHDNVASVWDFLGSCVIGIIITWFTFNMFWESPFDTMEFGYSFDLSGIPKNSYFYDRALNQITKHFWLKINDTSNDINNDNGNNDNQNK